jgi:hypothetical protein
VVVVANAPGGSPRFFRLGQASCTSSVVVAIALWLASPTGVGAAAGAGQTTDHHYCNGCTPPLDYKGGPVLETNATTGLTVTPVYWAPAGASSQFPGDYESIINGFVANVAAASGADNNVFSVDQEYYDNVDGPQNYAGYDIKAGNPVVDTDAMPASGCKPIQGATVCLTDQQLRDELTHLTKKLSLPTDIDHFYPVFFAPNMETQDRDGSNSANSYCGYHRSFGTGPSFIDYPELHRLRGHPLRKHGVRDRAGAQRQRDGRRRGEHP